MLHLKPSVFFQKKQNYRRSRFQNGYTKNDTKRKRKRKKRIFVKKKNQKGFQR
jgi:hypothetical protein